ncbi:glycoside hydrolase family 16 protein [Nocardioides jejuensis]|uniref:Glycoside hydrolase family 16 protein n=1 Tax=Nocardioides jejuensis TaxID=2502782 RepID=A0A4R1BSZ9_9ACTN|nr:glycoside hydrolase family 16 protein [Nocardioides jejuensis]TCJ20950.1 glycoside hydrolase family 16 protein [Nocardioides jejuensis]
MSRLAHFRARTLAALALTGSLCIAPAVMPASDGATATYDACGAILVKQSGENWSCSFVDNFSGTRLDTTKWVVQDSSVSGFMMNNACFDAAQNHALGGGFLKLSVTRKPAFNCDLPYGTRGTQYMGGGISTYGKFSQAYGRFEVRMKVPNYDGPGLHGGFWMNPQDRDYGIWPGSGEIDVAEWLSGTRDKAYPSLHYTGSTGLLDTGWDCSIGSADVFHKYAVVWSPETIDFYYDGSLCFSRTWQPTDLAPPAPFDKPFTLALVAANGAGLNNAPTSDTPFPSTFTIDYVKAWS